jgi:hypothetical protein
MSGNNRLFAIVAYAAIVVGFFSAIGGVFGIVYTYQQAAVENITTPEDARIAEAPVRGPLTMWAQADIITTHQLNRTEGLRYAEMPRLIPVVDEAGNPVIDEATGEPMMGPNQARLSWIDATSLITVLSLGIISYAFSLFAIVVGLILLGMGLVVRKLAPTA